MKNFIIEFWRQSYRSDTVAFKFELFSFIVTLGASLALAITAKQPNMSAIYPFFFLGSITACYSNYRRKLAWGMLMTIYFTCANVFGFCRATGMF